MDHLRKKLAKNKQIFLSYMSEMHPDLKQSLRIRIDLAMEVPDATTTLQNKSRWAVLICQVKVGSRSESGIKPVENVFRIQFQNTSAKFYKVATNYVPENPC